MTFQNNLDIKGNLQNNPLAELLRETADAGLSGSFRLTHESHKIIIYLTGGKIVFVVSNARQHRFLELLARRDKLPLAYLAEAASFANDLEIGESLQTKGLLSKPELDALFSEQIEEILTFSFAWTNGEWIFSPLTRLRDTIRFDVNLAELLAEYGRNLPFEAVNKRFKKSLDNFGARPFAAEHVNLLPPEAFVLSRFEKSFLKIPEVETASGLPERDILKILYTLWLGGFLFRQNWASAFSERKISEILSAKLSLKKEETAAPAPLKKPEIAPAQKTAAPVIAEKPEKKPVLPKEPTLAEYLERAENAASFYEVLSVAPDAETSALKQSYFTLAKLFHPDKFHQEKDAEFLKRIRDAFAQTAQAYDTLKNTELRRVYDYKLSKNLVGQKPKEKDAAPANQTDTAKTSFDEGLSLLMAGEYNQALPLIARAVHLAPSVARYHAYYGKALSANESQRYKAEAELQTAIKLEPGNPTFRLVSAEFYIQFGLVRRAEGELQRLLATSPGNREALALLESLQKK